MTKTSSFPNQLELDREVAVELKDRVDLLKRYFQSILLNRTPTIYGETKDREDAVPGTNKSAS